MIKLEVAQSHQRIKRFTKTILHNKLYVFKTWGICTSIRNFKNTPNYIKSVILARNNGEYVGCCMYVPNHEFSVQTFVKHTYRRKGIGKHMLKKLQNKHPLVQFTAEISSQKNQVFYKDLLKMRTP